MRASLLFPVVLLATCACSGFSAQPQPGWFDRASAALARHDPGTARAELLSAMRAGPQDAKSHLLLARAYLELGDGVGAEAEVDRASQAGAASGETHHLLAHALLLQGKLDQALREASASPARYRAYALRITGRTLAAKGQVQAAEASLKSAAALAPKDAATWTDIGQVRLAQGDKSGAATAASRALAADPRFIPALLLRSDLATAAHNRAAAADWTGRALAIDGSNVPALLTRASIEGNAGRFEAMLGTTRQVIALDPSNPYAFQLQARLAVAAGRDDLARTLLAKGGSKLETYPPALLLGGLIDYRAGNFEQAIDRLGRLVAQQPGNLRARRLLAAAKWKAGDAAGTVEALAPVADQPTADHDSLRLLASALERTGDRGRAALYARRAAGPDPRVWAQQVALGDQAMETGDWAGAARIYEKLHRELGDRNPAVLNNLAWAYFSLGQSGRGLPLAERAVALAPGNPSAGDTSAWILFKQGGGTGRPLQLLQAAASRAPANPNIRWHLAQVLMAAGQPQRARQETMAALATGSFPERDAAQALLARL